MEKYGIIYKITNKVNGKIYIGQTKKKLAVRWAEHKNLAFHIKKKSTIFHKAIKKYGPENFQIEEFATCFNIDSINFLEEEIIKNFNSIYPFGYNMTFGGKTSKRSSKAKKLLSKAKGGSCFYGAKINFPTEILKFNYIRDAERELNISSGQINDTLYGKLKQCKGWAFSETKEGLNVKIKNYKKKRQNSFNSRNVKMISPQGEVSFFSSSYVPGFNQANVWLCCEGKQKETKGYKFEWGDVVRVIKIQIKEKIYYVKNLEEARLFLGVSKITTIQKYIRKVSKNRDGAEVCWETISLKEHSMFDVSKIGSTR